MMFMELVNFVMLFFGEKFYQKGHEQTVVLSIITGIIINLIRLN